MSLQDPNFATDKHLQTALRNAPDQDLAPSQSVRDSVLNYAENAVKPAPKSWLKRALSTFANWHVKTWQVASMGALASMLLVIVMVREQAPQEPVWMDTQVRDLAQNKAEARKAAPASANTTANTTAMNREAARDVAIAQNNITNEVGAAAKLNKMEAKRADAALEKNDFPAQVAAKQKTAEPTEQLAESAQIAAAAPASADKAEAELADTQVAEASANHEDSKAAAASAKASPLAKPNTPNMSEQMTEKLVVQGGAQLAKQDIAANHLQILKLEIENCDSPNQQETLDVDTNYKILVICNLGEKPKIDLLQNEVSVYNQTMRVWFKAH